MSERGEMDLLDRVRLLTEPYATSLLECDGLTRVLCTVLAKAGIASQAYGGIVTHCQTGEQTPPHLWLAIETTQGRFLIDYRVRLWLLRNQNQQTIPHGVFQAQDYLTVQYEGEQVALLPLDERQFALLTGRSLGTLYPFGYRATHADEYFRAVMTNPRTLIVEARLTPFARSRPAWCRYGTLGLEQTWHEQYRYYSNRAQGIDHDNDNWLGNKNYKTGGPIALVNPTQGVRQLLLLLTTGWNVLLVCGCPDYGLCHRKHIVELVHRASPYLPYVLQPGTSVRVQTLPQLPLLRDCGNNCFR